MALKSRSFVLISLGLLFIANLGVSSEFVPVYLWQTEQSGEGVPALPRVSTETFGELINNRLNEKTLVVTFAEPNLSPEDFNAVTQSGERVFNNLARVGGDISKVYLPQVQTPIRAVSKLFAENITTVTPGDFKAEDIETSAVIIDLNDVQDDEDRNHMLARHDKIIVDIYQELLKKYTNVVALFTGRQASWIAPEEVLSRKVRDTTREDSWVHSTNQFLIYASENPTLGGQPLGDVTGVTSQFSDKKLTVTLAIANNNIEFVFAFDPAANEGEGTYWLFESLTVGGVKFNVPRAIYPPSTFSYQCTNQVFDASDASRKLVFKNLQIQPFQTAQTTLMFGDPYFCVGFTSPAIWSGIFVTFILAMIMAIGLMMMMDMKTMDRFDDPKGKTIVVNVAE